MVHRRWASGGGRVASFSRRMHLTLVTRRRITRICRSANDRHWSLLRCPRVQRPRRWRDGAAGSLSPHGSCLPSEARQVDRGTLPWPIPEGHATRRFLRAALLRRRGSRRPLPASKVWQGELEWQRRDLKEALAICADVYFARRPKAMVRDHRMPTARQGAGSTAATGERPVLARSRSIGQGRGDDCARLHQQTRARFLESLARPLRDDARASCSAQDRACCLVRPGPIATYVHPDRDPRGGQPAGRLAPDRRHHSGVKFKFRPKS